MNSLRSQQRKCECPLLSYKEFSPRLKGPFYYKSLHSESKKLLSPFGSQTKITDQKFAIHLKPILIPDLMGRSQIQCLKIRCPLIQKSLRSQSSNEQVYGIYGSKWKRLISQGKFSVKQIRHQKIIYRFKIYVRAVQLMLTYFKFKRARQSNMKSSKRLSKARISIVNIRKQSGQSTLIPLIQQYQAELLSMQNQILNVSTSDVHSPQSLCLKRKQKTLSQISFDHFLKRPIQQFIKNKNLSSISDHKSTQPTKRTCKTEQSHKRFASIRQLHRKLQLSQAYSAQQ
ncbi:unnamed protein product (macronuclear) [Paramecium tetraurelia]|uniref:AP2/ERF domain-containing protein n=1 Tax=Paramecium tetraurelia TaxID=5888 RepID=A0BKD5_PARTE|nr:uncharacterized protein GSPATT00029633001 [Paramecium tetraurelia]CAK59002.1 unnamed protein product [Paramecium tetraurelia]|eukprot:XP_001426400.1 hypothetical protein (macronuclear) [Paramecium tetraurelia strain d4-2]